MGRSNIRFYEKEKLIEPVKNTNNGYKDYIAIISLCITCFALGYAVGSKSNDQTQK